MWGRILVVIVVVACAILTMPGQLYFGDNHGIRLAATNLYLRGDFGIAFSRRDELFPYLTNPGQFFIENDERGQFFSRWGELNTVVFALPEVLRRPTQLGISDEIVPYANALNILFIVVAASYLMALSLGFGASQGATLVFILCVFFGTFEWVYLRAQTYEVMHLAFFLGYFYHMSRFFAARGYRHLFCALVYLLGLVLSKSTFFILFISSLWVLAVADRKKFTRALVVVGAVLVLALAVHLSVLYWKTGVWQLSSEGAAMLDTPDVFSYRNIGSRLNDYLISRNGSLLMLFIPLVLAIPFWPAYWREQPLPARLLLNIFFITTAMLLLFYSKGETCYGPRYFVFILPLMALPLVRAWSVRSVTARLALVLCVASSLLWFRWHYHFNSRPTFVYYQLNDWAKSQGAKEAAYLADRNQAQVATEFNRYLNDKSSSFIPLDRYATQAGAREEFNQKLACNFYFAALCPFRAWWAF